MIPEAEEAELVEIANLKRHIEAALYSAVLFARNQNWVLNKPTVLLNSRDYALYRRESQHRMIRLFEGTELPADVNLGFVWRRQIVTVEQGEGLLDEDVQVEHTVATTTFTYRKNK